MPLRKTSTIGDPLKPSILIVDDNSDLLELLESVLKRKGYIVSTASSGEEGLAALEAENSHDLVLLDVEIGDMTGPEFLDVLENGESHSLEQTSFVYCTSGPRPDDVRVKGYLNKMSDLTELVSGINRYLNDCPRFHN